MRLLRRLLVTLLVLALAAGAVLLVVEVVRVVLDRSYAVVPWREAWQDARGLAWDSGRVRLIASVAVGLAVVLLVVALWPARSPVTAGTAHLDRVEVDVDKEGLRRALQRSALEVDGVRQASVALGRRRVRVRATGRPGEKGVRDEVTARVTRRLEQFSLERPPRVRTRFRAVDGTR